jgi:WD40 repeat protein/tRNA A-37 threonylcarbamoyl transferase component Bud32
MISLDADSIEKQRRVEEVLAAYIQAVEAGEAPDREVWLRAHPDLESELASYLSDRDALANWAGTPPRGEPRSASLPRNFGPYRILSELARGGMGVVYQAAQPALKREVALKMILTGRLANRADVERFRREAEAAASLDHPRIVPIYEVGEHAGQNYYTMKLVGGGDLGQHADRFRDDPRSAATLMAEVARAVHYAHQRGILHRDLKPSNILLDAQGQPYVADFGLARRLDQTSELTGTGAVLGTPSYMAPEQASGDSRAITTAADIYGAGAVLYCLITGRPPQQAPTIPALINGRGRAETPRPSAINPRIDRDLETICLKCLDSEPTARYASCEALAQDLDRWLRREPIEARRIGPRERFWRWCLRNPKLALLAGTTSMLILTLAVGGTATSIRLDRLAAAERSARERAQQSDDENRWRLVRLYVANGTRLLDQGDPGAALIWFAEALRRDRPEPQIQQMHLARMAATHRLCPRPQAIWPHPAAVMAFSVSPDGQRAVTLDAHGAVRLVGVDGNDLDSGITLLLNTAATDVELSPDGSTVAAASTYGTVRLWDRDGRPLDAGPPRHGGSVLDLAFSRDGRSILTGCEDGKARIWDVATGRLLAPPLEHGGPVRWAVFSPEGARIATAGVDGSIRLWTSSGKPMASGSMRHEGPIRALEFSPVPGAPGLLLSASQDGTARLWRPDTCELHVPPLKHQLWVFHAAFSPDGQRVVTASHDGTAVIWDVATGRRVNGRIIRHDQAVRSAAFSHDGLRVATAGFDGIARVWDARTGAPLSPPLHHPAQLLGVQFDPSGSRLFTSGWDQTLRLWDLKVPGLSSISVADRAAVNQIAMDPAGKRFATAGGDGRVRIRDLASGQERAPQIRHSGLVHRIEFSPDGQWIASASQDGTGRVWNAATGTPRTPPLRHNRAVRQITFTPDGERVATASLDGTAQVWDAATGRKIGPALKHRSAVAFATFSPDGKLLATGAEDGNAWIWDLATGRELFPPMRHDGSVAMVAFAPAGDRLLVACCDGSFARRAAYLHDATSGDLCAAPMSHADGVAWAAFSPDPVAPGRIVTASEDETARVWDAETGRATSPPMRHQHQVWRAIFSPDGLRVATAGFDATARVWDAATGEPLTPRLPHPARILSIAFTSDGARLLTGDIEGNIRIWDLPSHARPQLDPLLAAMLLSGQKIDLTGGLVPLEPDELVETWRTLRSVGPYSPDFR